MLKFASCKNQMITFVSELKPQKRPRLSIFNINKCEFSENSEGMNLDKNILFYSDWFKKKFLCMNFLRLTNW